MQRELSARGGGQRVNLGSVQKKVDYLKKKTKKLLPACLPCTGREGKSPQGCKRNKKTSVAENLSSKATRGRARTNFCDFCFLQQAKLEGATNSRKGSGRGDGRVDAGWKSTAGFAAVGTGGSYESPPLKIMGGCPGRMRGAGVATREPQSACSAARARPGNPQNEAEKGKKGSGAACLECKAGGRLEGGAEIWGGGHRTCAHPRVAHGISQRCAGLKIPQMGQL